MELVTLELDSDKGRQVPVNKIRASKLFASLIDCCHTATIPFPGKFSAVYDTYTDYLSSNNDSSNSNKMITDQKLLKTSLELADFIEHEQFALYCIRSLIQLSSTDVALVISNLRCNSELQEKIYLYCPLFLLPENYVNPRHPFFDIWLNRNCGKELLCGKYLYKYELSSANNGVHDIEALILYSRSLSAREFVIDGEFLSWYHSTKSLYKLGKYRNGQQHGTWRVYYPNGSLAGEAGFMLGKRCGEWKIWPLVTSSEDELPGDNVVAAAANTNTNNDITANTAANTSTATVKPSFECVVDGDGGLSGRITDTHIPPLGTVSIQFRYDGERCTFYYLNAADDHTNWGESGYNNSVLTPRHYIFSELITTINGLLDRVLWPRV